MKLQQGCFWGLSWDAYSSLGREASPEIMAGLDDSFPGFWSKAARDARFDHRRRYIGAWVAKHSTQAVLFRIAQTLVPILIALGAALALYILVRHCQTGMAPAEIVTKAWHWAAASTSPYTLILQLGLPLLTETLILALALITHFRHKNYEEVSKSSPL